MFHISESRSLHNTSHVFQCDFQWLYFSSIAYHNEWASDLFTGYHCSFLHHVKKECDGIVCNRGIGDGFIVFWRKFSTIDIFGIHSRWEKRKHHDVIISSLKIPEMFQFNAQDQMCKDKVPCCVFGVCESRNEIWVEVSAFSWCDLIRGVGQAIFNFG